MKRFIKNSLAVSLISLLVIFLSLSACTSKSSTESNSIRIGAISPFTGEGANYGKAARTAIDLAVDEINSQGGINKKKLEIIYEDDKGTPQGAIQAFQKLANVDKVPAILGPFYSSNVLAVAPEANRQQVVILTGTATSDNIRNAGDYIFRVCPSNDEQARTIASFAFKKLALSHLKWVAQPYSSPVFL